MKWDPRKVTSTEYTIQFLQAYIKHYKKAEPSLTKTIEKNRLVKIKYPKKPAVIKNDGHKSGSALKNGGQNSGAYPYSNTKIGNARPGIMYLLFVIGGRCLVPPLG